MATILGGQNVHIFLVERRNVPMQYYQQLHPKNIQVVRSASQQQRSHLASPGNVSALFYKPRVPEAAKHVAGLSANSFLSRGPKLS